MYDWRLRESVIEEMERDRERSVEHMKYFWKKKKRINARQSFLNP